MKTALLMTFGMMAAIGVWMTLTILLARGIACTLKHYGLSNEWALVPLGIGILLAGAAFLSDNPIVLGTKP